MWEETDGFGEQNKRNVIKYNSADFQIVHKKRFFYFYFLFFSCKLGVLSWKWLRKINPATNQECAAAVKKTNGSLSQVKCLLQRERLKFIQIECLFSKSIEIFWSLSRKELLV